jgi:hypothetical protein
MSIPGYTVSFADIQNEYGGSDPITINEYYRGGNVDPYNTKFVLDKQSGSDHPNTSSIASSGQIDLASFRNTTCLLGFNRYSCTDCGNINYGMKGRHFYTYAPGNEFIDYPNYYQREGNPNYFYIFSTSFISGTTPLYRFFSRYNPVDGGSGSGGHFYTTSYNEGAAASLEYEGVVGWVRTYQTANSLPIYRSDRNGDWLYSYDSNEGPNAGYTSNGIGFYAYTNTNWRA